MCLLDSQSWGVPKKIKICNICMTEINTRGNTPLFRQGRGQIKYDNSEEGRGVCHNMTVDGEGWLETPQKEGHNI